MAVPLFKTLRQLRELQNLTQEHLAHELNISPRAYSKIENGDTQLSVDRLEQIARILGLSPQQIFDFNASALFHAPGQRRSVAHSVHSPELVMLRELYEQLLREKERLIKTLEESLKRKG